MHESNNSNLIGGPEPIERSDGWSILIDVAALVAVACSGYLVFTSVARPRVSGATRSATLQWQQRRVAVEKAVIAAQQSQEQAKIELVQSAPKPEK